MDPSFTRSVMPASLLAVSAGVLYAESSGVYAFDAVTGAPLRHLSVPGMVGIALREELLQAYQHLDGGRVAVFRLADGAELWSAPTHGRPTAPPVLVGEIVLCCTIEGDVLALDARDGAPVWTQAIGPIMFSGPVVVDGTLFVAPAVNAPDAPSLHALDARTGQRKWSADLTESTTHPLAVQAGVIYVCAHRSCAAFRANDGAPIWRQRLDGAPTSGAVLSGAALYLTEEETRSEWPAGAERPRHLTIPTVTALNTATGDQFWRRVLSDGESPPHRLTTPACSEDHIYVGADDGALYALDREGKEAWRFQSGGDRLSTPLVSGDGATVYIGANDGNVLALDGATGSPRWSAMTDTARVAVVGSRIMSSFIGPTTPEGA